ncbi:hypothetical protein LCGC14_0921700 [marine sediment metagenome]|uniref:Uncharacterized protein n=1 Tax=marine sediment metagenome TaxID=412755 RepID=A0A0F9NQM3_9ZZZZ
MHTKSRKCALQRYYLTLATQHYARLTPSQKAITRHQFEEVEYETGHSQTKTKLLSGRQLFISKEMHSLKTTGKQLILPYEVCIVLTDPDLNPLEGQLDLYYLTNGDWQSLAREEIGLGNWLFSLVPAGKASYHPIGEAIGYYDPEDPIETYLDEVSLKQYHYHKLYPTGIPETLFDALGTSGMLHVLEETYQKARNANSGTVIDNNSQGTTGQSKFFGDNFNMWRAGLFFDTTALLATSTIVEAWLRFFVVHGGDSSAIHDPDQTLIVVSGEDLSPSGLTPADYGQLRSRITSYGQATRQEWLQQGNDIIDIPLDKSIIVKEGITKLALRGSHDINNIPDEGGLENNRFDYHMPRLSEQGRAWLRVKYLD